MSLSNLAVKRPVTVKMFVVGVVLLGLISLTRLKQNLFPAIEYPQITVVTEYKGAAPQEIEMLITRLVEESVGTVSGVKNISSISKEELSVVMVELDWGSNMDIASMAVREKIDLIKERLPRGSSEPIVVRYNPFELPVMVINITGDYTASDLLRITELNIKTELEKIDGVASCVLSGGAKKEIKVDIDSVRLNAAGLSLPKVIDSLKKSNLNYPAGTIEESFYEQMIRTVGEFKDVAEVKTVPLFVLEDEASEIKRPYKEEAVSELDAPAPTLEGSKEFEKISRPSRKVIFLRDVANVYEGLKDKTALSRYNNEDTISVAIQKRAGANTVAVAKNVRLRLKELKKVLPKGMRLNVTYDQSGFIKSAIKGVASAAVQGGLLAFIVLLFFLRNLRSSVVVSLCIPISVMVTFAAMYFKGISLNMISLGGLALGIGMLVDNAIVVIENITRMRQNGESPKKAASHGASEVASAIVSSTITTIIVFLPMVFVSGIAGQLFKELAFTVIVSLCASLVVALSFIPSISAFDKKRRDSKEFKSSSLSFFVLKNKYQTYLDDFLDKKHGVFIAKIITALLISVVLFSTLDKELMPSVDQGQFAVELMLPPGTTLKVTDKLVSTIEKKLLASSGVDAVTVSAGSDKGKNPADVLKMMGPHQARLLVNLKPARPWWAFVDWFGSYRNKSSRDYVRDLKSYLEDQQTYGAQIKYVVSDNVFSAAFSQEAPVAIEVKGYDLDYLKAIADKIKIRLETMNGVYGVRDSIMLPSPENRIEIDKDKSAVFGLTVSDIAMLTQTALDGKVASTFKRDGDEIDIRVRLREEDREDVNAIRRLIVNSDSEYELMLDDIAKISYGRGPTEIQHKNQERTVFVWANLDKRSINSVAKEIEKELLPNLDIKPDYSVALAGETVEMKDSFKSLVFALLLSLLLVYMVMAGQFESFKQPFIIMFTIPLAIIGVAFALFLSGIKVSIMASLGIIVLGGIVVNNGIVLIDCINGLRKEGKELKESVVLAASLRLRPIMMTAATTVLGLMPLAFALSDGAKLQQPMAVTVVGGLLASTFLSLFVVPLVYYKMENKK